MANFDPFSFSTLEKHFVGFDGLFKKFNEASETFTKAIPNYPPYNIVKVDDNKYVIELAVAGFGKHNLEITTIDGTLTIAGHTNVDDLTKEGLSNQYLYKGIADRNFTRKFSIADTVEIKNAELINGMLKVWLENIIPESKKPKKVEVTDGPTQTSSKLLLEKDNDVK
jgi:molecular chaperone IbpA